LSGGAIVPGILANSQIIAQPNIVNRQSTLQFTYVTLSNVLKDDKFKITIPDAFRFSGMPNQWATPESAAGAVLLPVLNVEQHSLGLTGTLGVTDINMTTRTVTISRCADSISRMGEMISFSLSPFVNRYFASQSYLLQTVPSGQFFFGVYNANDELMEGAYLSGPFLLPAPLNVSLKLENTKESANLTALFSFDVKTFVPSAGEIFVFLPDCFEVPTASGNAMYTLNGKLNYSGPIGVTFGSNKAVLNISDNPRTVVIRIPLLASLESNTSMSLSLTGLQNRFSCPDENSASNFTLSTVTNACRTTTARDCTHLIETGSVPCPKTVFKPAPSSTQVKIFS